MNLGWLLGLLGVAAVGTTAAVVASRSRTMSARPLRARDLERFVRLAAPPVGSGPQSPNEVPFVWALASADDPRGNIGIDATAQWWSGTCVIPGPGNSYRLPGPYDGACTWQWLASAPTKGETVNEVIEDAVQTVLPILIAAAGVAIGGAGGAAIAFALSTWSKLAQGKSITRAVAEAAVESKELGSQIEKTTFMETYSQVASRAIATPALQGLKQRVVSAYSGSADAEKSAAQAFDAGAALGRGKQVQDLTVEAVKARLWSDDERRWLVECLSAGATLRDWVFDLYGNPGLTLLEKLTKAAAIDVDAGQPQRNLRASIARAALAPGGRNLQASIARTLTAGST